MKNFKLLNFQLAVCFLLAHNGLVSGQLSNFFPFNLFGSSQPSQSSQPTRAQPQSLPNLFPVLGGGTHEGGRDPSGGTWPYFSNSDQQQQLQQQQQQQIGQPSQQPYLQQPLQQQQSPFAQTPQQQQSQFQPSYPNQNSQQIYGNQQPQQNWQQQHQHPYLQQPQSQDKSTPQQSFNPFNNNNNGFGQYPNNWFNNFYPQQFRQQQQPQQSQQQPQQPYQQQPQQQPQQQFQQQPQQTLESTPNNPRPAPIYPSTGQQHQPNDQSSYPNNPNPTFSNNNPSYPSGQGENTLQGGQTPTIDHSQHQQQPAASSYPPAETVQQPSLQPQAQPQPSQWDDGQYNPGKYANENQNGANRPVWNNYDGENLVGDTRMNLKDDPSFPSYGLNDGQSGSQEGNINAVEQSELADVDKVSAPSSWVFPNN